MKFQPDGLWATIAVRVPGLALAIGIALIARLAAAVTPGQVVGEVLFAVALGLVVGNAWRLPSSIQPGLAFAFQRLLRLAIVLLGARLSLGAVLAVGGSSLALIICALIAAFSLVMLLGTIMRVSMPLRILLAVGSAICGNTAIVATAPVIDADGRDVPVAVAIITLVGTISVFAYPLIGNAIGLSDTAFGLWSGIAINDTSQVIAASSAHSDQALEVATVVKLVRNALMAPAILLIACVWQPNRQEIGTSWRAALRGVPVFVLGFLLLASLRTIGVIDGGSAEFLGDASSFLILSALAAVGMNTRLSELYGAGGRPMLVGAVTAFTVSVSVLATILLIGIDVDPQ